MKLDQIDAEILLNMVLDSLMSRVTGVLTEKYHYRKYVLDLGIECFDEEIEHQKIYSLQRVGKKLLEDFNLKIDGPDC